MAQYEKCADVGRRQTQSRLLACSYIRKILANKAVVGTFTPHATRPDDDTGARRDEPLEPIP